jgi:SAM-dependent methyltransferase
MFGRRSIDLESYVLNRADPRRRQGTLGVMPLKEEQRPVTDGLSTVPDQRAIWDDWHRTHTSASRSSNAHNLVDEFVDLLPHSEDHRILEVGCGQGREAIALARMGLAVDAIDLSPLAVALARKNAQKAGVAISIIEHDAAELLPYDSHRFAGVFAHLSLHYFDETTTRKIFAELARVTMPGGGILFTVRSVHDRFYGRGDQVDDNLFCFEGHVRGFFDKQHVRSVLIDWDECSEEYYDIAGERRDNPGSFLKVTAKRRST